MTVAAANSPSLGAGAQRVPLGEWMRSRGVGDAHLARTLGTHRSTVSRLRRGLHRPSPELRQSVFEVTGGEVDLIDPRVAPEGGSDSNADIDRQCALFEEAFDFVNRMCGEMEVELDTLEGRIVAARSIVRTLQAGILDPPAPSES